MTKAMSVNFFSHCIIIGTCMAVIFLVVGNSVVEADEVPAFFLKIAKNMPRVGRSEGITLERLNDYFLKTAKHPPRVGKRDVSTSNSEREANAGNLYQLHKRMITHKAPENSETGAWKNFPLAIEGPPELWRTLATYTNDKYGGLSDDIDNEIWQRSE